MVPPIASDPWLAGRRFGIVIDAGSSGSRLQIYSWRDPEITVHESNGDVLRALPTVEKGAKEGEDWVKKVEPGISSFSDNPDGVATYLAPLLQHARDQIPPSLESHTPLFLFATAGMRLLTIGQQAVVLKATCDFLRLHSHFRIDDASSVGPCGSSVRIITGEEEGLFGWIAVNYLMDGFSGSQGNSTTYGFLDMGGASTQIAFEPSKDEREKSPNNLVDVNLRLLNGEEMLHQVFVTTWLGYGTNQARERYVAEVINEYESSISAQTSTYGSSAEGALLTDPCLPKDLRLEETPVQNTISSPHSKKPHALLGTGSFEQCLRKTSPLLNKSAPCPDAPCLFNGIHVPHIDFSASHFIGISEYWYSSEHVFGLGGPYDFVQYERAASEFCGREWTDILREHQEAQAYRAGHVGGADSTSATVKWGEKVEIPRLQMQCFKAAWIANVLHEGIGMPRIVDPGGNGTTHGDELAAQAESKGLGRPLFQSVDTVADIAISWTLGKMVLEASKEVRVPNNKDAKPIVDPMAPVVISTPTGHPSFLDKINNHISPHLPPSLSRESLGFAPVGLLFYLALLFVVASVLYRLRHSIRLVLRRLLSKKDSSNSLSCAMEEGKALNGSASSRIPAGSSRRWFSRVRRLITRNPRPRPPPLVLGSIPKTPRHGYTSPTSSRPSPNRSISFPSPLRHDATPHAQMATSISRSSSPSNSIYEDAHSITSLSSLSRSRNSSQMNLSATLVPRQTPLSRAASLLHVPYGGTSRDDFE